jgi:hypothetical protein
VRATGLVPNIRNEFFPPPQWGTFFLYEHLLCGSVFICENYIMSLGTILLIILILVLLGVIPTWPHSSGWGYGPSGLVGVILIILLILVLLGRI